MHMNLKNNERIDDLQCKGLKIIQKTDGFCFGMDAILLSHFANIPLNARVMDLGTGTGIIPILMSAKTNASKIVGLEIQKDIAEMAQRSVCMNGLQDKISILCGDIKNISHEFEKASFDCVVSNPPYMSPNSGIINPDISRAVSRHEIMCTFEDIIKAGDHLLIPRGKLTVIHRPHRLVDLLYFMRQNGIEPKRLRMVFSFKNSSPSMVLIEAIKGEKPNLTVLPPLYIYNTNGEYSEEIKLIYDCAGDD